MNAVDFEKMLKDSQIDRQRENWERVKGHPSNKIGKENKTGSHLRGHIENQGLNFILGKMTSAAMSLSFPICKMGNNKLILLLTGYNKTVFVNSQVYCLAITTAQQLINYC